MACNCKTNEEIEKLYNQYRVGKNLPNNPGFIDYVKYYVLNSLLVLAVILAFPLLLIYVLALLFWREDERLHVNDFNLTRLLKGGKS